VLFCFVFCHGTENEETIKKTGFCANINTCGHVVIAQRIRAPTCRGLTPGGRAIQACMKKAPSSKRQAERATLRVDIEMPNVTRAADIFMHDQTGTSRRLRMAGHHSGMTGHWVSLPW
jgi:hypothetical protein